MHVSICPVRTAFADAYWQRMLSEEISFGQASVPTSYLVVRIFSGQIDHPSNCNSKYLEVRMDVILNTSQYCNAVTKRQNPHKVEFTQQQYIKNVQQVSHCAWLGLGLSSSDLSLSVLVLLAKLIAGAMTLICSLYCFRKRCHSHEPRPSCSRSFTTMRQKYGPAESKRCRHMGEQKEPTHRQSSLWWVPVSAQFRPSSVKLVICTRGILRWDLKERKEMALGLLRWRHSKEKRGAG